MMHGFSFIEFERRIIMSTLRRNALVESIVWFFVIVIFMEIFFTSENTDVFMWILAYSTMALTFFFSATLILITDLRSS